MELLPTILSGVLRVQPRVVDDLRGRFVKTFHRDQFAELGLPTDWREEYFSTSRRGVIRGLHFQSPPHDHAKLVYCLSGRALDVVVDLREGSPTYGRHVAVELDADRCQGMVMPAGMAHGFAALTDQVVMAYKVTSVHAPANDCGILWSSLGIDWGVADPIVSDRDRAHPPFEAFRTPFTSR